MEDGPIPRLCFEYVTSPEGLDLYRQFRTSVLTKLSLHTLISTILMGDQFDMERPHSIILVKRVNLDDLHQFTIQPITPSINRLLKR